MLPSKGRIVLFRSESGDDWPAVVTGADNGVVDLQVFMRSGVGPRLGVPQSGSSGAVAAGTWRWPERVE